MRNNFGGNLHNIDTSQMLCVGTQCADGLGDASLGGSISPSEFRVGGTAALHLDSTRADAVDGAAYALLAVGGQILKRNHTTVVGLETAQSGGSIGTY